MKIGIIGFGRFGKLLVKYLAQDFEVLVFDRNNNIKEIEKMNAAPETLQNTCKCDIVIPAVPISSFENIIREIKPFLKDGALVIDVCSVKEYPVKLMKEILPGAVQILATHPMFGPDSASDSLSGRKIALCKIRIDTVLFEKIKSYLKSKGLVIIETTAEEHDRQAADSLALTHFIGRALIEYGSKELEIDTEGYKRLLKILETVEHDSWQLFSDINTYNRFSKSMRKKLIRSFINIDKRLKE